MNGGRTGVVNRLGLMALGLRGAEDAGRGSENRTSSNGRLRGRDRVPREGRKAGAGVKSFPAVNCGCWDENADKLCMSRKGVADTAAGLGLPESESGGDGTKGTSSNALTRGPHEKFGKTFAGTAGAAGGAP